MWSVLQEGQTVKNQTRAQSSVIKYTQSSNDDVVLLFCAEMSEDSSTSDSAKCQHYRDSTPTMRSLH